MSDYRPSFGVPPDRLKVVQKDIRTFIQKWYGKLELEQGDRVLVCGGDPGILELALADGAVVTVVSRDRLLVKAVSERELDNVHIVEGGINDLTNGVEFNRVILYYALHDLVEHKEKTLPGLMEATTDEARLLVIDKVDLGLQQPTLEDEAEYMFADALKAQGIEVPGLMTCDEYRQLLTGSGWQLSGEQVWGSGELVQSLEHINLKVIAREVNRVSDHGLLNRLTDRLNRLQTRTIGTPALCGRWAAVCRREQE